MSVGHPQSVLDLSRKWFTVSLPVKPCSLKDIASTNLRKEEVDALYEEAEHVLEEEKLLAQKDRGHWYSTQFLTRGTQADKIASAAVKLADTDFMFFLESFKLLSETARADSHHYEAALKALATVWPKLLPPRPLKSFAAQHFAVLPPPPSSCSTTNTPIGKGESTSSSGAATSTSSSSPLTPSSCASSSADRKKVLVYWYIEDYLKRVYAQFLSLCEGMLRGERVAQRRVAWLEVVGKLVCEIAESRTMAMSVLICKLGDPNHQVAHKAYHHILHLLSESSMHQASLFTELEKIIFTKNCPVRTMRYAINIMNQLVFSKDERKLALKSVHTYLSLFRQLAKTEQLHSSVATAIMVGLRRAYPYAGADLSSLDGHIHALFILAHHGYFQQRVCTLSLLQQVASNKGSSPAFHDRWYRALYSLLLISPHKLPQASQLTVFFTMLHKAMRSDNNPHRVAAFVHRLLQRCLVLHDAMVCAILLLVGELAQAQPLVRALITGKGIIHANATESDNKIAGKIKTENNKSATSACRGSPERSTSSSSSLGVSYDPTHRTPDVLSGAARECVWTLDLLARHSHPSVVQLAILLLFHEDIVFDAHPLDDLTTLNFLEMMVDPSRGEHSSKHGDAPGRGNERKGGASGGAGEEKSAVSGLSVFHRTAQGGAALPSASDPYFIQAKPSEVPVSALFLHRYAVQRKRFLDGLSQTRSTWGDASGEADVALRVCQLDKSLFGASGVLAEEKEDEEEQEKEEEEEVLDFYDTEDRDEFVPSSSENSEKEGDELDDEDDLDWGSERDELDEEVDSGEEDEDNFESFSRKRRRGEDDEGEEFGELMELHQQEKSKTQQREEKWEERRIREGGISSHGGHFRQSRFSASSGRRNRGGGSRGEGRGRNSFSKGHR